MRIQTTERIITSHQVNKSFVRHYLGSFIEFFQGVIDFSLAVSVQEVVVELVDRYLILPCFVANL